jgi:hypothetical protein
MICAKAMEHRQPLPLKPRKARVLQPAGAHEEWFQTGRSCLFPLIARGTIANEFVDRRRQLFVENGHRQCDF